MRESGTEDGCGTGGGNGRQAAEPRRTAPPRPRPQIRTQRRKRRKSPARRGGSRATQAGGQGVKIQPPRAASLLRFFRREACVKNLTPLFPHGKKLKSRRNTTKNHGGRVATTAKAPFPHFRTVILPSETLILPARINTPTAYDTEERVRPTSSAISVYLTNCGVSPIRSRRYLYTLCAVVSKSSYLPIFASSLSLCRVSLLSPCVFLSFLYRPRYDAVFALLAGRSFFGGRSYFRSPCQQTYKEEII